MSERMAEDTTITDQLEEEEKSRGEGEGEEKIVQPGEEDIVTDLLALEPGTQQEERKESKEIIECQVPVSKNKQARVQSVFSRVRNQIRAQPGREASGTAMLELVQCVTRQLERSKEEQGGVVATSPGEEDVLDTLEAREETTQDLEKEQTKLESREDECVVLLQEVLSSIEALRKEVRQELNLLRQESRSHTDEALRGLEARLTHSLKPNPNAISPVPIPLLPGAPRRRTLRRTMTTLAPMNCAPLAFRPRCMSEPVGGRGADNTGAGGGSIITHNLPMRSKILKSRLEPLPPSLLSMQHTKKPLRSKPRMAASKPAF